MRVDALEIAHDIEVQGTGLDAGDQAFAQPGQMIFCRQPSASRIATFSSTSWRAILISPEMKTLSASLRFSTTRLVEILQLGLTLFRELEVVP